MIPLKGGKNKNGAPMGPQSLDQDFLRAIQDEYATRFLEQMKIEPTAKNKENLLRKQPLTSCELQPGWNSSGWLADEIKIYPNKIKRANYENSRDNMLEQKRQQEQQQQ